MKLSVKQMNDWNYYAFIAEDVEDEAFYNYFRNEPWWQVGENNFIRPFDNVPDFEYCAKNFAEHGETAIRQQLKLLPSPWETALTFLIGEMKALDVDWYLHGSAAMALWGIDVTPKDINVIIANYSDFDRVREHFCKLAIQPFERCDGWIMSGLGTIFRDAVIGFAFHNKELEPFDMSALGTVRRHGETVHLSTLEMLRRDNENYGRPERVRLIEDRMEALFSRD